MHGWGAADGIGKRLLALLLLCLTLGAATGQARDIAPAAAPISLRTCLLKAAPGMVVDQLFATPDRFDCTGNETRYGPGDFWVLLGGFPPIRSSATRPVQLRWGSTWQDRVTLHVLRADGSLAAATISSATTSPHLQLGAQIALALPPADSPITAILVHVEGAGNIRGVLVSPYIEPVETGEARTVGLTAIYSACAGLGIALIVYNMMLWGALRLRFLLYYCMMVGATLVYGLSSSGALAWMLPWIDNNDRLRINYVLLAATAVTALVFIRHFFEEGILPKWLLRAITAVCAATSATAIAVALLAPYGIVLLDRLYALSIVLLLAALVPILICARRARSHYLGLFLIAWTAPILFAILRVANGLGFVPHHFWLDNSTIIGMAIESLLSSLAVAYRIRTLSTERDDARKTAEVARSLADTDPLTGLLNRRAFLRNVLAADGSRQRLLLIDIDHFKRVNDRFGHAAGDEVLRRVAALLGEAAGTEMIAARLGGEEFGLLGAIDHPGPGADALVEQMRAAIMPHGTRVTLSIGVAEGFVISDADWQRLYRRADAALYRAKQSGRDRACLWNEALDEKAA